MVGLNFGASFEEVAIYYMVIAGELYNGSHIGNGRDETGGGMPSFSDDMAGRAVAQLGDGSAGTTCESLADDV